jgi:alkanesulfonate monooxygenase SsuD/methylene tetrahydromethanopterin reductase-like flavin-dependent oxidoreductase (luciferase family)
VKFGVSFLPDAAPGVKSAEDWFRDALELSVEADRGGLHTVKMTEHYLHPYGGYCPNPLTFLAAVAARTEKIRLKTGGLLPVFHHPLQLAAETAMLDALSGGRLDVGFARAYLPYEFAAFRVSLDESRQRFGDTVRAVIRLWTEDSVNLETPWFALRGATSLPRPAQRPHPPVWGTAVRSAESFTWLGENAFGLMVTLAMSTPAALRDLVDAYRRAYRQAHPGGVPRVAISIPLYVAETDRQAIDEGDRYLQRYLDVWTDAATSWDHVDSQDYPGYRGMAFALRRQTPKSFRANFNAVVGSVETVVAGVRTLAETLEPDEFLWQIDFGWMPIEHSRRTLRLFMEQVMPRLSAA